MHEPDAHISHSDDDALVPELPSELLEDERDERDSAESGKVGWALAWLLGVPLPILLIIYLISRC